MDDFFNFMSSPSGMRVVNGLACAIFTISIVVAVHRQSISLGSMIPRIEKSRNPRAYWSILFVYGVIVAWTGVRAAFGS